MIISPQYDEANPFQDNGLAIVSVDGRSGAIDRRNQYRVKPKFDSISPFTEGRAIAIDRDGFKVIDEQGSVLTAKAYSFISPYRDGLAMASAPGSAAGPYGYLNLQGGEAIPFVYESAGDFKDGKAVVKVKDGEYALIGRDGNRLHTYNLEYAGGLGEGLLTFKREKGGKYGYMNEQGEVVIAPQYVFAQPFRDGRAVVNMEWDLGDRYGLIDPKGEYVLKPQYNRLDQLGEHRLAVGYPIDASQPFIGSKYAIADDRGRFLTKPVFLRGSGVCPRTSFGLRRSKHLFHRHRRTSGAWTAFRPRQRDVDVDGPADPGERRPANVVFGRCGARRLGTEPNAEAARVVRAA